MKSLWTEKYRPKKLDDYVWRDEDQKKQVTKWIEEGSIPHILLSGNPGTGKTTLAKILINELDIDPYDIMEINASRERGVDTIRNKITNFAGTVPFGKFKVALLDECDYLTLDGQAVMRGVMEQYVDNCRFILTCVDGDTKVYTPYGYKLIKNIKENDAILAFDKVLPVKYNKKSLTTKMLKITTAHGFDIKVTPEHKFFTFNGECDASKLKIGGNIPIRIDHIIGNDNEYSDEFSFSHEKYAKYLKSQGIPTQEYLDTLKKFSKFIFTKNHKVLHDHIIEHNITMINIADLSRRSGIAINSIRNFIAKIAEYITSKYHTKQDYFVYVLDLEKYKADYVEFTQLDIKSPNHIPSMCRHRTVEYYVNELPEKFSFDQIESIGRLVGFMEGDGHMSSNIFMAANNVKTLKKVHADIIKFFPNLPLNIKNNGKNSKGKCSIYTYFGLFLLLKYFGATVGNKTTARRTLPSFVENKLFFKGFMQGFYDSDGRKFKFYDKKNVSCQSFSLTQNIYDDCQISFFEDIAKMLQKHFNIFAKYQIVNSSASTFGGSPKCMLLEIHKISEMIKYLKHIGTYYDPRCDDSLLGYLLYKQQPTNTTLLTYVQWLNEFYIQGYINDTITSIVELPGENIVYDCCLDQIHFYTTNGFISHNCNYPNKIIPALHSRTQGFHIEKIDPIEFTARCATILVEEQIEFDLDVLDNYVIAAYPDLRKCINSLQMASVNGKLISAKEATDGTADYKLKMVDLFKEGNIIEARRLACNNVRVDEIEDFFRWCYNNLGLWSKTQEGQDKAILIIRDGLVNHTLVSDVEINLAATLVSLTTIDE